MAEQIVGVGGGAGDWLPGKPNRYWRSPDLPAPSITTSPFGNGGNGWILVEQVPESGEANRLGPD